uniref:SJCHGC03276 protein n=1 Tax=Schistosoma japonicum TaxID=6182 RepID=Q5DGU3_SCHJA|nr:SJCHGC03276 protein [Schistosoma japonicum]
MNVALALLFILQLHSIQLQLISGGKTTFTEILTYCDELLLELNWTTKFKNDIDKSMKKIGQIREGMQSDNIILNTFKEVTKIIETIQSVKKSFEKLTPLMNEINPLMKKLKTAMEHQKKMKKWQLAFKKSLKPLRLINNLHQTTYQLNWLIPKV